jgi:enoyl-CoA hydratase
LIVGANDVHFADVVGTRLGMCGMEYFAHPWEFGARKTKELMLTGDSIDVHEAHALGTVSKVFPAAELAERTLEFARRIAKVPTMAALTIAKEDSGVPNWKSALPIVPSLKDKVRADGPQ